MRNLLYGEKTQNQRTIVLPRTVLMRIAESRQPALYKLTMSDSTAGISNRHDGHHVAQKLTIFTCPRKSCSGMFLLPGLPRQSSAKHGLCYFADQGWPRTGTRGRSYFAPHLFSARSTGRRLAIANPAKAIARSVNDEGSGTPGGGGGGGVISSVNPAYRTVDCE